MIKQILVTTTVATLMISSGLAQSTNNAGAAKFVAMQSPDQWVFSKFKGTDVVGPNDETIGGVNDLLFDKSGKIMGVVVGVGGFLGIGQKNIAIDMSAFQPMPGGGASTQAPASGGNDPTNIKLKVAWTKEQLQQAPDFQYFKPAVDSTRPTTTGMGQQKQSPMAPLLPPQTK